MLQYCRIGERLLLCVWREKTVALCSECHAVNCKNAICLELLLGNTIFLSADNY